MTSTFTSLPTSTKIRTRNTRCLLARRSVGLQIARFSGRWPCIHKWMPDIVIVGITYSGAHPDYDALRATDYTPTPGDRKGSGDGPKFLHFMKAELIPFIELNYRGDPTRRILGGHSLGGLFTLYAMLTDPTLFWGYLAGSPAIPGQRFFGKAGSGVCKATPGSSSEAFLRGRRRGTAVDAWHQLCKDTRGPQLQRLALGWPGHRGRTPFRREARVLQSRFALPIQQ